LLYREIDNRQLSCPQPVVNTKKALERMCREGEGDFALTVLVDNQTAKENVSRFARNYGCNVSIEEKEGCFHLKIYGTVEGVEKGEDKSSDTELYRCSTVNSHADSKVLLIKSSNLGEGSEELGSLLMRSFIFTLKDTGSLPEQILFLNTGVYLTTEDSPVLDELAELQDAGVKILSCGTCLDYFQLKEKLVIGEVTNMYDTVETLFSASRCITL